MQGQNTTPSSRLHNSGNADLTHNFTSTQSATPQWSIGTPITTLDIRSHSRLAPEGTSQRDSTCRIESSPTSSVASTLTPLSSHANLISLIPDPEDCTIITYPLRTWATEMNQRQREFPLPPQVVSTPQSVVSSSRSIHQFGHSDMTHLLFATCTLLELYMGNSWWFMSASNFEIVSYATQHVVNALAEAPHWLIIEMNWNTAMQQKNIWSIAFKALKKEILIVVCWSNGPHWIFHDQIGNRFKHKSISLYPFLFNLQETTQQSFIISTMLNPTQSA